MMNKNIAHGFRSFLVALVAFAGASASVAHAQGSSTASAEIDAIIAEIDEMIDEARAAGDSRWTNCLEGEKSRAEAAVSLAVQAERRLEAAADSVNAEAQMSLINEALASAQSAQEAAGNCPRAAQPGTVRRSVQQGGEGWDDEGTEADGDDNLTGDDVAEFDDNAGRGRQSTFIR